jgi:hypothetical protein
MFSKLKNLQDSLTGTLRDLKHRGLRAPEIISELESNIQNIETMQEPTTQTKITLSEEELFSASRRMIKMGGSFVSCIGEAYAHADPFNKKILAKSFNHYFIEYSRK